MGINIYRHVLAYFNGFYGVMGKQRSGPLKRFGMISGFQDASGACLICSRNEENLKPPERILILYLEDIVCIPQLLKTKS